MAINVFPVDAVAGAPEYTGRETRQVLSVLVGGGSSTRPLGGRSGVCPGPTTVVSVSGGSWTVGRHAGVLDLQTAVEAGVYLYANDAVTSGVAITAADATYARKDIVYVKLDDPAEADGSSVPAVTFGKVDGTPSASPAAPATPARSMVLAEINVPNVAGGGASSATVTQVWPYAAAAGGVITVRTTAERDLITFASAVYPVYADCLADGVTYRSVGSGWVPIAAAGRQSYTPVFKSGGVVPTLGNGTLTGSYADIGGTVHWRARFTLGSTTAAFAAGNVSISLPVTPAADVLPVGTVCGVLNSIVYNRFARVSTAPDVIAVDDADVKITNASGWTTGSYLEWAGSYPRA